MLSVGQAALVVLVLVALAVAVAWVTGWVIVKAIDDEEA